MEYKKSLQKILSDDPVRMSILYEVQALELNDGWIGAGFVRDAVWDYLHGYALRPVSGDVDVVWFDSKNCAPDLDRVLEERLKQQLPTLTCLNCVYAQLLHLSAISLILLNNESAQRDG